MTWHSVKLGDVCTIIAGQSPPGSTYRTEPQGLPFFQGKADFGVRHPVPRTWCIQPTKKAQAGDILISVRAPVGPTNVADCECCIGRGLAAIRPRKDADRDYILHALKYYQKSLERMGSGSTFAAITTHHLNEFLIPLPPLAEQKRIAAILDEADALRRKRREAIAKLDTLLQSVFFEMFGDRAAFSSAECCIGDVLPSTANAIRTGPFGSQLLHSEFVEEGVAVLGIDNAVKNEFSWSGRRYITRQKYEQLKRYTVHPGDVIITIMGTCGRCAVVPENIPLAINTKHLCCLTLDKSKCLPEFLHSAFLMHPKMKSQLEDASRGAIMDGLNMGIIKNLRFSFPPLAAQKKYVVLKGNIEQQKHMAMDAAQKADHLFSALQHQAFSTQPIGVPAEKLLQPCLTLDF